MSYLKNVKVLNILNFTDLWIYDSQKVGTSKKWNGLGPYYYVETNHILITKILITDKQVWQQKD